MRTIGSFLQKQKPEHNTATSKHENTFPRLRLIGGDMPKGGLSEGTGHAGRKNRVSLTSLIACLVLLAASLLGVGFNAGSYKAYAEELPNSITVGRYYFITQWGNTNDGFFDKDTGSIMYCANQEMHAPQDGTVFTGGKKLNDPMVDYILYHGYDDAVDVFFTGSEEEKQAAQNEPWLTVDGRTYSRWGVFQGTRNALWIARGTSSSYTVDDPRFQNTDNDTWAYTRHLYYEAKAWVDAGAQGPENGYAILWPSVDGGTTQAMLSHGTKRGDFVLEKRSLVPTISDNNPLYSLEGAVYGLFSDVECTQEQLRLTTDAQGNAYVEDLLGGTYYLKELEPSRGMALDETLYTLEIVAGETTTVSSEERPLYDMPNCFLGKLDAISGLDLPQGKASLKGAQFTIDYYDNLDGNTEGSPAKSWVVETDADGKARLSDASRVSGDSFFKDENGLVVCPLGTYRIYETTAPVGYKLNNQPAIEVVSGALGVLTQHYVTPLFSEEPVLGQARVVKVDADFHEAKPQGNASLAGAEIAIITENNADVIVGGTSFSKGSVVAYLTTKSDGSSYLSHPLPFGSYTAYETLPPEGYLINTTWSFSFDIVEDGQVVDLTLNDDVLRGGARVYKYDFDSSTAVPQGDAELSFAELTLENANEHPVVVNGKEFAPGEQIETLLITNEEGIAESASALLPYGSYRVYETKAPKGYQLNTEWMATITIDEQGSCVDASGTLHDQVIRGGVELNKIDTELSDTRSQANASLAGAQIGLFNLSARDVYVDGNWCAPARGTSREELLSSTPALVLTTDAQGYAASSSQALPYGRYAAIELLPSEGYLLNEEWIQYFSIESPSELVRLEMLPQKVFRGDVVLVKRDAETHDNLPLGEGELSGTVFSIINASENPVLFEEACIAPGEVVTTITSNTEGVAQTKGLALPYGTYLYEEVESPYGYLLSPGGSGYFSIQEHGVCVNGATSESVELDEFGNILDPSILVSASENQVIRGELHFNKIDFETQRELAGIPFLITSLATGEWHVAVTDENGIFDSSSFSEGARDNANDHAYTVNQAVSGIAMSEDGVEQFLGLSLNGTIDDSLLDPTHGLWFAGRNGSLENGQDEALSSFPVGSYQIDELPCEKNMGSQLIQGRIFTVHASERSNNKLYDLGTLSNRDNPSEDKQPTPSLQTSLVDNQGSKLIASQEAVELIDTVSYSGLIPGVSYVLEGSLRCVDEDGKLLDTVVATATHEFTAQETGVGSVDVSFVVDVRPYSECSLVAFERLSTFDTNGALSLVASHEDPDDEKQTVWIGSPGISTLLSDVHGNKTITPSSTITLVDLVQYEGLTPGIEYSLHGSLIDKASSDALTAKDGSLITVSRSFTPTAASGSIELSFTFDSELAAGKTLVAFESLMRADTEIAAHRDIESRSQSVCITKAETPKKKEGPSTKTTTPSTSLTNGRLPKTGETHDVRLIISLCLGGVAALLFAFVSRRQKTETVLKPTSEQGLYTLTRSQNNVRSRWR